jgi:hypothetical protein
MISAFVGFAGSFMQGAPFMLSTLSHQFLPLFLLGCPKSRFVITTKTPFVWNLFVLTPVKNFIANCSEDAQ